jgi:hypothetical protein
MDAVTFYDHVGMDKELRLEGIDSETGNLIVFSLSSKVCTSIPFESLKNIEWTELRSIMTGEREPQESTGMRRITNWDRPGRTDYSAKIG